MEKPVAPAEELRKLDGTPIWNGVRGVVDKICCAVLPCQVIIRNLGGSICFDSPARVARYGLITIDIPSPSTKSSTKFLPLFRLIPLTQADLD